jgi:tetraacyldisaccharide-1-P 4'-kinase
VISRGYGRCNPGTLKWVGPGDPVEETGDEPAEIKAAVPEAMLVLSPDRLKAAHELVVKGVDLIIADDGYQNLGFKADRTVLLVTDVKRTEMPYRDFDSEAARGDYLIQLKGRSSNRFPHARRIGWKVAEVPTGPLWLWTAIADPAELIGFYEAIGVRFRNVHTARDHAHPDPSRIQELLTASKAEGARLAITRKDAVKLAPSLRDQCVILGRDLAEDAFFDELFEGLQ